MLEGHGLLHLGNAYFERGAISAPLAHDRKLHVHFVDSKLVVQLRLAFR